ncbi:hypothetical protein COF59_08240 [Bacillus pseudomycoides]|uniref:hypothetical protein n=1 Tax=Bacillus pseudomycoides TaxID=64104 RepID=UPI000BFE65A8|nr:hypothetical protein [Bacillus pseudomycoides]PHE19208.1 hypothetical protein COF59_08240 [Bacillus pseudomycoides]
MKQLTIDDVVGSFDYRATSTAERFLNCNGVTTYAVDFFDKDKRQKLRWFEAKTVSEAEGMARKKYGQIQIVKVFISDRSLKEIMALD